MNVPAQILAKQSDPQDQILREAMLARALHDAIAQQWPPESRVGPFQASDMPAGEPWDTMRKLLRRYPTRKEAEDTIELAFSTAALGVRMSTLERQLEATEVMAERRRVASEIHFLRGEQR